MTEREFLDRMKELPLVRLSREAEVVALAKEAGAKFDPEPPSLPVRVDVAMFDGCCYLVPDDCGQRSWKTHEQRLLGNAVAARLYNAMPELRALADVWDERGDKFSAARLRVLLDGKKSG